MSDKDNKSFWKRITAILMSTFLAFSHGGSGAAAAKMITDTNIKAAAVATMNIEESKNFITISRNYSGYRDVGDRIISLKDLLSVPVGEEVCDTMVPQGLAIKDGLILVTCYDGIAGYKSELSMHSYRKELKEKLQEEGKHDPHNSVIAIIDESTKELLTTIELPDKNHVGGIALDDNNAYIAKSADKNISVISLDKIREAARRGREEGIKTTKLDYDYDMDCGVDASFVSMRENRNGEKQLVVGTWVPFPGVSKLSIFDFGKKQNLIPNQSMTINSSANGATFVRRGDEEYLIVACSLGRILDSNIYVYNVDEAENGKLDLSFKSQMQLPPMVEEVVEFEENGERKLAVGTEAFTKRYEIGKSNIIPDGIMVTKLDKLLDREGKTKRLPFDVMTDVYKEDEVVVRRREEDEKDR